MTTKQLLVELKEKQTEYQIEPFVLDFLEFWSFIHEEAPKYALDTAYDFLRSIWDSHTLPFYQKYKQEGELELQEGWVKTHQSIVLVWKKRGNIMFPCNLVVYEIFCHKEKLFEEYLHHLNSKQIRGTRDRLYEYIVPKIVNHVVPLEDIDIAILKANQWAFKEIPYNTLPPSKKMLGSQVEVSQKTLERRMKAFKLIEMFQNTPVLNTARVGYETYLVIHHEEFPKQFNPYLHISVEMSVGKFSLIHIPIKNQKIFSKLNEILNPFSMIQMTKHSGAWNLNQITSGIDRWKGSIPVIDPSNKLISPSPDINLNLIPEIEQFRKLNETDIKILDFLSFKGTFDSITEFSRAIGVSRGELSKRLAEYSKEHILLRFIWFYSLGLTTLWLYISDKNQNHQWLSQLTQLPFSYLYLSEEKKNNSYFGFVKIPSQWINQFGRQMDRIKKESGVIYYLKSVSSGDYFSRGRVSLKETYPREDRET